MAFENKGGGPKGGTYLICSAAERGWSCAGTRWKYRDFEASFLASTPELDLESVINANEAAEKRTRLESEIAAIQSELSSTSDLMEKTYRVLHAGGPAEFIAGKLNELTAKQSDLNARLAAKEAEQQEFLGRDTRFYTSRDAINDLVKKLQGAPSDELYKVRAQIAARLKVLVERLLVSPIGDLPKMRRSIERLEVPAGGQDDAVIAHTRQLAAHPDRSRRYFAVGFRDAAVRAIFPSCCDPLRYEQEVVAFGADSARR